MHSLPQIMFGYILGDLNNHLVTLPYTFRGKNGQNMVVLSALPDRISNKAEDFICLAWSWLSTLVPNDEFFCQTEFVRRACQKHDFLFFTKKLKLR
jgi:hypothetical protein